MPTHFLCQVLRLDPDKDKNVSQLVHWGPSLTPWMNKLNKSYKYDWECRARKPEGTTEWILSFFHISRLPAAWLGEAEPFEAQAVVRETLNYASEKGGEIGCWLQYHPLLLYLLSHSLTDRWGHLDEVSQEVSAADSGLIDTVGRVPFSPVFCTISQNWGKYHSPPSHPTGGQGRAGGESSRLWRRHILDDTLMTHLGLWNRPRWLWGLLHRFSGMRTISCYTYNEQWGQKVTLLTAFPLPKKINSLLELHCYQRRNGMALKWRQKTFTFVRYDYRCSLDSLLLL